MSPRTKKQLLELRERSRKAIMENALRLFAQNGFHQTTVQQIARGAGVSKGLVYNYFTSKEDLLESIIRAGLEEARKVTMHIFSQPAARDKMKTMIDWALNPDLLHSDYWKMYSFLLMQPRVFERYRPLMTDLMEEFIRLLTPLLEQMGFPSPEAEARMLAGIFDGIGLHAWVRGPDYPTALIRDLLYRKYLSEKEID